MAAGFNDAIIASFLFASRAAMVAAEITVPVIGWVADIATAIGMNAIYISDKKTLCTISEAKDDIIKNILTSFDRQKHDLLNKFIKMFEDLCYSIL